MENATVNEADFQSYRCAGTTRFPRMVCTFQSLPCPSDPVAMSRKVVTCAALDAHLETFRVLIGEHSECWHLHSRRPLPRRGFPSGQERAGQSFSARKAALLTGIQSMGCGLRVHGTPRRPMEGLGCKETIISIYHQMLGLRTPGIHGHFGHGPCSTKSRFCIGAADSARWKSCRVITFLR